MSLTQEQLRDLLQYALLAPSADNRHPVRFELDGSSILIYHARTNWAPAGYQWVLDLLSLGALTENLVIAASAFGARATASLFPDPGQPGLALRVDLTFEGAQADPLCPFIPLRHTNRRVRFYGPPLNTAERAQLDNAAGSQPDCTLHWLEAPGIRKRALNLMWRAETERFRNPVLHEELFAAIRFDVGWRESCEVGLPPGALGVELPLRGFFSQLRHWPVMRLVNRLGADHLLGWRSAYLPCRLAPHLGLLAVKKTDTASVFAAGRGFQRLWLVATSLGRVLQPMPASALYALQGAPEAGIPPELQHALRDGWTQLGMQTPLMLFRMGCARAQPVFPGRPPADIG